MTATTAPDPARCMSRRLRWFRVAAVALSLLGFVAGAELILRGIGYGHPTGFLVHPDKAERLWTDNPFFLWRFMPPGLARWPAPIQLRTPKPAGVFRVLVLGESAAMGDPEPAFGFSRVLQVLLEARLPGQTVEVINTGIPAINSHIVRAIAADCRPAEADVWVLYLGHNEVLGPGGLTSAFGSRSPIPWSGGCTSGCSVCGSASGWRASRHGSARLLRQVRACSARTCARNRCSTTTPAWRGSARVSPRTSAPSSGPASDPERGCW
ncbi:MAG: hypothetical protein M5U12_29120 [Verrucomicrobia bacterium]|nr:hypothetical protein [Verrucomicrobiota bacterium]